MPTSPRAAKSSPLQRCCRDFLKRLESQHYSTYTIRQYRRTVDACCAAAETLGLLAPVLDGPAVVRLQETVLATVVGSGRTYAKYRWAKLLDFLIEARIVEPVNSPDKAETPRAQLRREYQAYLHTQRGLSAATIYHCVRFYERFMTFRFGEGLGDLATLTPDDLVAFLERLIAGSRPYRDKTPPTHLRSLFKFLFWSGRTTKNLADSIPRIAAPPPLSLPRSLPPAEIQRLIDVVRTDDGLGRRNYAMLLLMARLGLRAAEVVAIQLDDVDWRAGEILIRGKGKRNDRMPLPADVGASLAEYLRRDRRGDSRVLFVARRAPYQPFPDSQIVNEILRRAFAKTGLKPPQKYVGSHILRHSLAMDMLRHGASLGEIGDVLRHRSAITTSIYAKQDIDGLRALAQAWPDSGEGR